MKRVFFLIGKGLLIALVVGLIFVGLFGLAIKIEKDKANIKAEPQKLEKHL